MGRSGTRSRLGLATSSAHGMNNVIDLLGRMKIRARSNSMMGGPRRIITSAIPALCSSTPAAIIVAAPRTPSGIVAPTAAANGASDIRSPVRVRRLPSTMRSLPSASQLLIAGLLTLGSFSRILSFLRGKRERNGLVCNGIGAVGGPRTSCLIVVGSGQLVAILGGKTGRHAGLGAGATSTLGGCGKRKIV